MICHTLRYIINGGGAQKDTDVDVDVDMNVERGCARAHGAGEVKQQKLLKQKEN